MILTLSIASTRLTFARSTHAVFETGAVVRDAGVMIRWDLPDGGYDDTGHRSTTARGREKGWDDDPMDLSDGAGYNDTRRVCTSRRIPYRSTKARGREKGWDEILCDEDERRMGRHVAGLVLVDRLVSLCPRARGGRFRDIFSN